MAAAGARPGFAPGSFDRRRNAPSTCAGRAELALVSGADSSARNASESRCRDLGPAPRVAGRPQLEGGLLVVPSHQKP
jgi:hypothetical protein